MPISFISSFSIWDRLSKPYNFKSPHSPLASLLRNKDFTPGLTPLAFKWWSNRGFLRIADLHDHKGLLFKQTLIEKHQMPDSEQFRYTQRTHYMHTLSHKCNLVTMLPMEYLCHRYDKSHGHTSEIYTILTYSISQTELYGQMGTGYPRRS